MTWCHGLGSAICQSPREMFLGVSHSNIQIVSFGQIRIPCFPEFVPPEGKVSSEHFCLFQRVRFYFPVPGEMVASTAWHRKRGYLLRYPREWYVHFLRRHYPNQVEGSKLSDFLSACQYKLPCFLTYYISLPGWRQEGKVESPEKSGAFFVLYFVLYWFSKRGNLS